MLRFSAAYSGHIYSHSFYLYKKSRIWIRPVYTTGNACFAEGLMLCRGPNLGHSAKTLFAEGQAQEPSAKNGPRQRGLCRPTADQIFAEGRGPRQRCPRQIRPVGSRRPFPSSFAEGHPLGPRQRFFSCETSFSANFFLKKVFAEGPRPGPRQRFF